METIFCTVLPDLIRADMFDYDYVEYEEYLYCDIFKKDLFNKKLVFKGKKISFRSYPLTEDRKETSFYHLITRRYHNAPIRDLDLNRCARLCWIKPSIETDHEIVCSRECFLYYEVENLKNGNVRAHLLNPNDRYHIILEDRGEYYLMVTAYHIDYNNELERELKKHQVYLRTQKPL